MNWIDEVIRDVCELPDRSSPEDWPEAMLVTADELRVILSERAEHGAMVEAAAKLLCDPGNPDYRDAVRAALAQWMTPNVK